MMLPLALVAAVADDGAIGKAGGLPWDIPEDRAHFKRLTWGHAVVMGRKTWDEVGRPLPGRRNLVISRDRALVLPEAEIFADVAGAITAARGTDPEPFVIGGATIYAATLPFCTRIYLTEVHRQVDADTYFPTFDRGAFRETERRRGSTPDVEFVTLERIQPPG
jgi:dihydrofolate reductase